MKNYTFTPGGWDADDFMYVASAREDYRRQFVQEADHVKNLYDEERPGFDFISMVTKERKALGTVCETTCSFEESAAPLIVFSDDITTLPNGDLQYGTHFEVVIWKNGCNVWYIPLVDGKAKSVNVTRQQFTLEAETKVKLRVEFCEKLLKIQVNDRVMEIPCEHLPEQFHVGITACEGICKFYDLSIQ